MRASTLFWLASLSLILGAPACITAAEVATVPIDVGDRGQLMIDGRFMAESENVTLRMHPPRKMGPVLVPDRPWESQDIGFCVSVMQHEGQYKMWYMARDKEGGLRYCFARSADGAVWEKPNLGLIEYRGSKENNLVLDGVIETTVFLDPVAPPEQRFKTVSMMYWPDPEKSGLYVHTSPDGLHWTKSDRRVLPLAPDTANQAFYDTRLGKYVANIRVWAPLRKVGRVEMDDITAPWPFTPLDEPFYIWGKDKIPVSSTEVPIVFEYDAQDPPNSDHYNAACVQYAWADEAYFMFPSAYRHFPEPPVGKYGNDGYLDVQLAVSRDGVRWTRLSREPYVSLGVEGEKDCSQLYMAVGLVRSGNALHQYYGGYTATHGVVGTTGHDGSIYRLEQRPDGFVSADAAYEGGTFTTPPVVFSGNRLVLNIDAGAMGVCKVGLLDEAGQAIEGYAVSDCDEVGGNALAKSVTWRGASDLSALRGRPVRLRFEMRAAKLFSFQFAS